MLALIAAIVVFAIPSRDELRSESSIERPPPPPFKRSGEMD
jgi:hypothetical protein